MLVALFAVKLSAAPVDLATAKQTAQQFLVNEMYAGKYMAPSAIEPTLIKTEMGDVNKETPVLYFFNTSTTYLIVAGDDRAEEILAVGDKPLNLDRIPDGLKDMISGYKEQIDWLISNPTAKVTKPSTLKASGAKAVTYGPLLTALWDQDAPYWNQCKFTYNGTSYQCYTGCPATSASMVMYYWKWPTAQVDAIPSYTSTLELSYYNRVHFTYPDLRAATFDWAHMKDSYTGSYTTAQGNAVATLMRYVGQAEKMMYGTASAGGSGIYTTDTQNVVDMYVLFGYDESTCRVVQKSSYSATNWATLIQNEMAAGRPIVYMAVASNAGGHAFNVDGYRDSDSKYHVNFGWSGEGNNWMAMNAFSDGDGYTFNQDQQAVIGIQPASMDPQITASVSSLDFSCEAEQTVSKTFTVTGRNLSGNITATLTNANGAYTVSPTSITTSEAAGGGKTVTVTFAPQSQGTYNGSIKLSSTGAQDVTIALNGTATVKKVDIEAPVLADASNVTQTGFTATWTHNPNVNVTYTLNVMRNGSTVMNKSGITAKTYNVTGLTTGNTYTFRVKAVPVDATIANESSWSNNKTVTLTSTPVPTITPSATSVAFGSLNVGQNSQKSVTISGANLEGNITATLNDPNNVFAIDATTITPTQAAGGKALNITFTPKANVNYQATITLTSSNATTQTITLTGAGTYVDPVMQPADESYININRFRADWTDQTPAANVASYTLEVNYVSPVAPVELLNTLLGTDFTGSATGYYNVTLTEPWGGTNVRGGLNTIIYFRNNYNNDGSYGNITYTVPAGYENQTFTMKITTGSTSDGAGNLTVATPQTSAVGHNFSAGETFAWLVTASSGQKITITSTDANYSPDIAKIEVYSGDATAVTLNANETGNETYRLITGITNKYYDVTNLIDEGTYTYKVKAVYTNNTESNWSNVEEVTLFENTSSIKGDVNMDGEVNVNDVTTLINYILGKNPTPFDSVAADVNEDTAINVNDVTALINLILN